LDLDTEMAAVPDKEFKNLLLKMINDLKKDSNRQINDVQGLDKKVRKMDEKFNKEIEIVKKK
jgi:hypothetical protein